MNTTLSDPRLVRAASFANSAQAHLARMQLAMEDIPAYLGNAAMATWFWHYNIATGGARVYVSAADAERAAAVLRSSREPVAVAPPWECGNCGERVAAQWKTCWHCGASVDGQEDVNFFAEPFVAASPLDLSARNMGDHRRRLGAADSAPVSRFAGVAARVVPGGRGAACVVESLAGKWGSRRAGCGRGRRCRDRLCRGSGGRRPSKQLHHCRRDGAASVAVGGSRSDVLAAGVLCDLAAVAAQSLRRAAETARSASVHWCVGVQRYPACDILLASPVRTMRSFTDATRGTRNVVAPLAATSSRKAAGCTSLAPRLESRCGEKCPSDSTREALERATGSWVPK